MGAGCKDQFQIKLSALDQLAVLRFTDANTHEVQTHARTRKVTVPYLKAYVF